MKSVVRLLSTLALLWAFTPALADVPTEMSVQGRLTNGSGAPVPAGLKIFTFKIFDAAAGGTEIWPAGPGEAQTLSTDANGLWNAGVGTIIPLTELVFQTPVRWLEVTVDDGVNPIETLPRIELRTNPYTYRAATSQQADSLAGNSLGDLADMFVDEAADTMSGQLRLDWDHDGTGGGNLEIKNLNDGYPAFWALSIGTWGTASEIASDDPNWNIGNASVAQGASTTNVGAYGYALGSNSRNHGVLGVALGGVQNYAGLFQGDLYVTGAGVGDSTVILPANAISSAEILDEPGIAQGHNAGATNLTSTGAMSDIVTVSITIPADGYIVVEASFFLYVAGVTGINFIWFQIDETAGGSPTGGYYNVAGGDAVPNSSAFYYPCSDRHTYFKTAGTYTFRLEAQPFTATGSRNVSHSTITATYFPKSYGTVTTVATRGETGDFSAAVAAPRSIPQSAAATSGATEADLFYVDLRELELKAAKTAADAEKARRELAEARLSKMHGPGKAPGQAGEGQNR